MLAIGIILTLIGGVGIFLMSVIESEIRIVFVSPVFGCIMFGAIFLTKSAPLEVHSSTSGYIVWKEETKVNNKVIKTTWHVMEKRTK